MDFISTDNPQFPRDVGSWVPARKGVSKGGEDCIYSEGYPRFPVQDTESYIYSVEKGVVTGSTVGLYSNPMREKTQTNKIFWEIGDTVPLTQAHQQMQQICRFFKEVYDYSPRVLFSANKSFHIYIGYPTFQHTSLTPAHNSLRMATDYLLDEMMRGGYIRGKRIKLNINGKIVSTDTPCVDIDQQCVGDLGRCSRPPYTGHIKNFRSGQPGKRVVPIESGWGLLRIQQESANPSYCVPTVLTKSRDVYKLLDDMEQMIKNIEKYPAHDIKSVPGGAIKGDYKQEIESLLAHAPKIHDGGHRICMHLLVPYLRCSGHTWGTAEPILRNFVAAIGGDMSIVYHSRRYWWSKTNEEGAPYRPMQLSTFFERYPDLNWRTE